MSDIVLLVIAKCLWALPFVLIGLVLVAATFGSISTHRLFKRLAMLPCPHCDRPVGAEAVKLAREDADRRAEEYRKAHSGRRLRRRVVLELKIHCPHCGKVFRYLLEEEKIANQASEATSEPAPGAASSSPQG